MQNVDFAHNRVIFYDGREIYVPLENLQELDREETKIDRFNVWSICEKYLPRVEGLYETFRKTAFGSKRGAAVTVIIEATDWVTKNLPMYSLDNPGCLLTTITRGCHGWVSGLASECFLAALLVRLGAKCPIKERTMDVLIALIFRVVKVMGAAYQLPMLPMTDVNYNSVDPCQLACRCLTKKYDDMLFVRETVLDDIRKWQVPAYVKIQNFSYLHWNSANQKDRTSAFK